MEGKGRGMVLNGNEVGRGKGRSRGRAGGGGRGKGGLYHPHTNQASKDQGEKHTNYSMLYEEMTI